jgi:hypothetical protein
MTTSTTVFFGFGIADNMFGEYEGNLTRRRLTPDEARDLIDAGVEGCLNPSHAATIHVMETRFGISVPIPERAPVVRLNEGDSLLVMAVSGLPRLEGRHEYTPEEVASATFSFSLWTVG